MKLQLSRKEFEVRDWVTNCLNLADFFLESYNFAQAEYCIFAGFRMLPLGKEADLRAQVQLALGKYYLERLSFGVNNFVTNQESVPEVVGKKELVFQELDLPWPEITDINSYEEAKVQFRLANTQFKKALEYY